MRPLIGRQAVSRRLSGAGGTTRPVAWLIALLICLAPAAAEASTGTTLYDRHGKVIATVRGTANQVDMPLSQIPAIARKAVVAIEDSRFFDHFGVDMRGTARALVTNLIKGRAAEGGSTITQQVARILYLNQEKTLSRKVDEAVLAVQLERKYSKEQILEIYLNRAYWGHGAYGIEAASQTYFGKSCRRLSLAEGALLAGLLQRPEGLTPFRNQKAAINRQHVVLNRMAELGIITEAEADQAKRAPLRLAPAPHQSYKAPYFTAYVLSQLAQRYGDDAVYRGSLRVWTTLDLGWQERAEAMVRETVAKQGKRYRFDQAAFVALDPRNGFIRAMVGGADFQKSEFNRAVAAKRQPGSTFKPFIYLTAFSRGISPTATESDAVVSHGPSRWTPRNYENERHGVISLAQALERSNNVIAVKLLKALGPSSAIDTARQVGIESTLSEDLSLALGASEVSVLELVSAYGVLANDGLRVEPAAYWRVADESGRVIEHRIPQASRAVDETAVRTLNGVLQGVVERGTATRARIGRPVAGKTGTTNDARDAWFVGYTPQLVAGLWVGNDNNSPMKRASGGVVCAPAWASFMKAALKLEPAMAFALPAPPVVEATESAAATENPHPNLPPLSREKEPIELPLPF